MLLATKLVCVVTVLIEFSLFGAFADLPANFTEAYMLLTGVVWLVSPVLCLFLAASCRIKQQSQRATLLFCALASGALAIAGVGGAMVPALQWLLVIAALAILGVQNRSQRISSGG